MIRKTIKMIAMLAALAVTLAFNAEAQSREVRKTVDFVAGGELKVHSDRGTVRLTGWDRNQVEVFARISPPKWDTSRFNQAEVERAVEATRIDVLGDARSLVVRANFDDVPETIDRIFGGRPLPEVHFEIRAPRSLNLVLDIDRGKATLGAIEGRLDLTSDRSSLEASDLAGEIRLRMDRGSAIVSASKARLNVHTDRSNTTFRAAQIAGDSSFDVSRGEVELRVPPSQGLYVSANRGRRADFETEFAITTRTFGADRVEGAINGGGPKLLIRTDRGKARLRQQ
jgi:hypothetical protein